MTTDYSFYSKQKTVEDLMLEVAQYEVALNNLHAQVLNESTNPQLGKDIAELERKIAAASKALAVAGKLKGDKGNAHKSNIMKQQAGMVKRLKMLKDHNTKVTDGGVIGKGEIEKTKNDKVAAKSASTDRRAKNKENAATARAKSKQLQADRKAAKEAAKKPKPSDTAEK